nr:hypothetical protein [Zea mays]
MSSSSVRTKLLVEKKMARITMGRGQEVRSESSFLTKITNGQEQNLFIQEKGM